MGSFSIWHWLIVLVVVLLLFGRGKIPELMGDVAKGIKSFKKGMTDDEAAAAAADDKSKTRPTKPSRKPAFGRGQGSAALEDNSPCSISAGPKFLSSPSC